METTAARVNALTCAFWTSLSHLRELTDEVARRHGTCSDAQRVCRLAYFALDDLDRELRILRERLTHELEGTPR